MKDLIEALGEPIGEQELRSTTEGTTIHVKWSGGNGPIRYILRFNIFGDPYAETDFKHGNVRHALDSVGRSPMTQVWKP